MNCACGIEYRLGLGFAVRLPNFVHMKNCQHHTFGIAQRDLGATRLESLGKVFGYVEGDRHGPKDSAGQPHFVTDAVVIGARHESTQWRKASAHQQFKIAKLPWGKVPRRPLAGMSFQLVDSIRRGNEINKFSTVRCNKMAARSGQFLNLPGSSTSF